MILPDWVYIVVGILCLWAAYELSRSWRTIVHPCERCGERRPLVHGLCQHCTAKMRRGTP